MRELKMLLVFRYREDASLSPAWLSSVSLRWTQAGDVSEQWYERPDRRQGDMMANTDSRVTIHMAASLDGFIARKDGSVDWLETAATSQAGIP